MTPIWSRLAPRLACVVGRASARSAASSAEAAGSRRRRRAPDVPRPCERRLPQERRLHLPHRLAVPPTVTALAPQLLAAYAADLHICAIGSCWDEVDHLSIARIENCHPMADRSSLTSLKHRRGLLSDMVQHICAQLGRREACERLRTPRGSLPSSVARSQELVCPWCTCVGVGFKPGKSCLQIDLAGQHGREVRIHQIIVLLAMASSTAGRQQMLQKLPGFLVVVMAGPLVLQPALGCQCRHTKTHHRLRSQQPSASHIFPLKLAKVAVALLRAKHYQQVACALVERIKHRAVPFNIHRTPTKTGPFVRILRPVQ